MIELVDYIAKSIVSDPESVNVSEEEMDSGVIKIILNVAEHDRGKIIGRQGKLAQAIRTVARVAAVKQGVKINLEIV
ncbi:MAG: KH domain-containing protein [SAR202 cluster bacterium]|nr:KH domain-containing protein [SAR202 cluster bacterium]